MTHNPWITTQYVDVPPGQIAAWAMLRPDFTCKTPAERLENATSYLTTRPIIGVLVQHRHDLDSGIPIQSRTVFAVRDEDEIVALPDAFDHTYFIGVYSDVDSIPSERIEEMADLRREYELDRLEARLRAKGLRSAVAS